MEIIIIIAVILWITGKAGSISDILPHRYDGKDLREIMLHQIAIEEKKARKQTTKRNRKNGKSTH